MSAQPRLHPIERYLVTVAIAAAVLWSMLLAVSRLDGENFQRKVELAFPEKRLLSLTASDPEAPRWLLAAGVTTLVREPYTLETMLRYGLAEAWHPKPDRLEIRLADERITSSAAVYLTGQFGISALQIRLRDKPAPQYILEIQLPKALPRIEPNRMILEISTGPMPEGFRRGLLLPAGDWGTTADLDQFTLAISTLRPEVVLPDWRGGVNPAAFYRSYFNTPWLRKPVMAVPELSLPAAGKGIIRRYQKSHKTIQAHLAGGRAIQNLDEARLRQRLLRAARERGVALLYLDPPAGWDLNAITRFYGQLTQELKAAGFSLGPADAARVRRTGYWAMSVIYWGVAGLMLLFVWKAGLWAVGFTGKEEAEDRGYWGLPPDQAASFPASRAPAGMADPALDLPAKENKVVTIRLRPSQFRWVAFYTGLVLMILHWQGSSAWSAKLASLLIAILAPLLVISEHEDRPAPRTTLASAFWEGGKDFFQITLWSLAAGAGIAVLLYHPDFVQRWDGFQGVKLAYGLPLLLALFYFFPSVLDPEWWKQRWQVSRASRRSLLLFGSLAVAALALLMLRSGNHPWLPVSNLELQLRDTLEVWLASRPRFKEFLFGHPLLLLGLVGRRFPGRENQVWPEVCLVAGLVGQLSIINSFCHAHTPLAVSLLRTGHGLWLGCGLGLLLVLAAWRWPRTCK